VDFLLSCSSSSLRFLVLASQEPPPIQLQEACRLQCLHLDSMNLAHSCLLLGLPSLRWLHTLSLKQTHGVGEDALRVLATLPELRTLHFSACDRCVRSGRHCGATDSGVAALLQVPLLEDLYVHSPLLRGHLRPDPVGGVSESTVGHAVEESAHSDIQPHGLAPPALSRLALYGGRSFDVDMACARIAGMPACRALRHVRIGGYERCCSIHALEALTRLPCLCRVLVPFMRASSMDVKKILKCSTLRRVELPDAELCETAIKQLVAGLSSRGGTLVLHEERPWHFMKEAEGTGMWLTELDIEQQVKRPRVAAPVVRYPRKVLLSFREKPECKAVEAGKGALPSELACTWW
jgi:hypothetical protein